VPPVQRMVDAPEGPNRWIVAPDSQEPWLPGAAVLLWACVRTARSGAAPQTETVPHPATPGHLQLLDADLPWA